VSPLDFLLPGIGGFGQTQCPAAADTVVQSTFTSADSAVLLVQAK